MIDDLYPIQFVEGVNENDLEYLDDDFLIPMREVGKVAIKFEPNLSAVISRIDVNLLTTTSTHERDTSCTMYSDFANNPSDFPLREGGSFKPKKQIERSAHYWQQIDIKPVTLIAGHAYWFVIDAGRASWALVLAQKGKTTEVRVHNGQRWHTSQNHTYACKLRFFGRIIDS